MRLSRPRACAAVVFAGLLAGCAQTNAPLPTLPAGNPDLTSRQSALVRAVRGELLYVANADVPSITEYRRGANGNVAPLRTIAGKKTNMGIGISGIAVDSTGVIYVTSVNGGVLEYAANAHGNVAPIRTITAASNGPIDGFELAVDGSDNLYVANGDDIKVFAPGANGVATPIADIAGPATTIGLVEGIAVDASGVLYAVDFEQIAVLEFAPGSNGNVPPTATIAGDRTTMAFPRDAGVSPGGDVYVSDEDSVEVFAAHATGNVPPARTITFQGSTGPYGNVAVSGNRAFLGQFVGGPSWSVGVFRAGLHGPSQPLRTIAGDQTQLNEPVAVTVR